MPFTKNSSNDDSGLHDLQAMASSAKKRRSQRLSSQMDAQDSLLQSAAALEAVVLPDPNKEQAPVSIADVGMPTATKAAAAASVSNSPSLATAASVAEVSEAKSSSGKGLYVAIALAAAAAVGAYVMLGGKGETTTSPAATPAVAQPVAIAPTEPTPTDEVAPALAVADDSETADEAAQTETATEPSVVEPTEAEVPATASADTTEKTTKAKTDAPKVEKTTKVAAAAKEKDSEPAVKKDEPVAKKADKPVETKLDSSSSLDDVLSSVTGGVDTPIAKPKEEGPTKTELGRGDVAKAMKKISPAAKSCYSAEEFSGMVTVKYSVGPDGSVSNASAAGAHANSKTGACVVNAVKKAKFPPFSGATMSFSFPFLLAP